MSGRYEGFPAHSVYTDVKICQLSSRSLYSLPINMNLMGKFVVTNDSFLNISTLRMVLCKTLPGFWSNVLMERSWDAGLTLASGWNLTFQTLYPSLILMPNFLQYSLLYFHIITWYLSCYNGILMMFCFISCVAAQSFSTNPVLSQKYYSNTKMNKREV